MSSLRITSEHGRGVLTQRNAIKLSFTTHLKHSGKYTALTYIAHWHRRHYQSRWH
jgi:hypothetical protein